MNLPLRRMLLTAKGKIGRSLLAIPFRSAGEAVQPAMQPRAEGMSLHGSSGRRKYLNKSERLRFHAALTSAETDVRLFCLVLCWSGARISEILALTPSSVDFDEGTIFLETLKKRRRGVVRQVPLPASVLKELENTYGLRARQNSEFSARRIWTWSRSSAWRRVKSVMRLAEIPAPCAMPKGLRHSFGVAAFQANVPPHVVQRWLGHASLRTTAIYADVSGREEREFAERMWQL